MGIVGIQHILEDVKEYSTKNDSVKHSYDEAIDKVKDAREAVHRFAAIYNKSTMNDRIPLFCLSSDSLIYKRVRMCLFYATLWR